MTWYVFLGGALAGVLAIALMVLGCCWNKVCPKRCRCQDPESGSLEISSRKSIHKDNDYLQATVPAGAGVERSSKAGPDKDDPTNFDIESVFKKIAAERILSTLCIDSSRLTLGEVIGHGQFGVVYKGQLLEPQSGEEIPVAVKTVQGSAVSEKDASAFIEEVLVMRGLNHKNVLSFLGLVLRENQPFALLPYMHNGNLKEFISHRDRSFTIAALLKFGVQIADGMHYLEQQKFVHRDLAARNCMVDKDEGVRIADFGLSRDIFTSDYYRLKDTSIPLPVRWMAPETLWEQKFTYKSDVWSFGVVLWELMTRGTTPYPGLDNAEVLQYIKSGKKMAKPAHAQAEIYSLMCECWREDPILRPTFAKLVELIQALLGGDRKQVQSYMNTLDMSITVEEPGTKQKSPKKKMKKAKK